MKKFKRIMALAIALAMVVSSLSLMAFAATGEMNPDTTMTVGGLEVGDEVHFYKLIKWVPSEGWQWASNDIKTKAIDAGLDLNTITGYLDKTENPAVFHEGVISAADGGKLAKIIQDLNLTPDDEETVATGASSVTYTFTPSETATTPEAIAEEKINYLGLYVALVTPAKAEYLYNPIYVAADYNPDNSNTNSITVEEGALSYTPAALAKKKEVTLTKTSGTTSPKDVQYDVAVGDTIPFTIESIVPEFSTSYQNPQYSISDTMSSGLELLDDPAIVVQVQDITEEDEDGTRDETWHTLSATGDAATGAAPDYTVSKNTNGFTVTLGSLYLKGNLAAKNIKVTYSAKVTAIDDTNVVKKDNTATVKFSNNPEDSDSYSLLEDKTYHYTFSLDANLLGNSEWENSELVKIGLSADGTEITQQKLDNGTDAGILEGAKFGLYTDSTCETLYTNNNITPAITGEYTSDPNGKLNISGLDAGTYYLKEISAPAGYIKSSDTWKIEIIPHYADVAAGSYTNEQGILVKYDAYQYLDTYRVVVTNVDTDTEIASSFTITNTGEAKKSATNSSPDDSTTKLNNTQGTELPSTGGIGTTIFYVVGALLVIGAGVVLITRRRMDA